MNTVFFDLDGTLLPMHVEDFMRIYMGELLKFCANLGYRDQKQIQSALLEGIHAMYQNDGSKSNEEVFWDVFVKYLGEDILQKKDAFISFYANEFHHVKKATFLHPNAARCISILKEKGYHIILSTNPLFPKIATIARIKWAGLDEDSFEYITTYEHSHYCKPNPNYYLEILSHIHKNPQECLMIGNDVKEDIVVTRDMGFDTYLLTDMMIAYDGADIGNVRQGNFDDLLMYLHQLPNLKQR